MAIRVNIEIDPDQASEERRKMETPKSYIGYEIERFIRNYKPRNWFLNLNNVFNCPSLTGCDVLQIINGETPDRMTQWHFIEAIKVWQKREGIIN